MQRFKPKWYGIIILSKDLLVVKAFYKYEDAIYLSNILKRLNDNVEIIVKGKRYYS